ncbi:MAG: potassium channel protein [Bacteroidetes bacterium]|nr:MAG: potassium channel protein [Bacteroidota bacterium]TAG87617.1 MAG: potassium channel protein [Bacteroidota bacterium]
MNRLFWAIGLFSFSLFFGTIMFHTIEKWTWLEAFYMTVITIGTVGFQEVHPLSNEGRIFTSFFIIVNFAIFAFFTSVITSYLIEGELKDIFNQYLKWRKVEKFNNHVIICGFGKNGHKAGEEFAKTNIPFIVIESHFHDLYLTPFLKLPHFSYIEGDATQDEILKQAGIHRARALITTLPKDADNVFVTLSARQLKPDLYIIARANETGSETKLLHAGANKIVRPDFIGGTYMANLVLKPEVVEFLDIMSGAGEFKIEEFRYDDFKQEYHEKTIKDLDIRRNCGAYLVGFKDDVQGFIINPNPDTLITKGDIVIVLGNSKQILDFTKTYSNKKNV